MKSEHDYRTASQRRFRLVYDPAASIPTKPKSVGTRLLDEDEFVHLWRWLERPDLPIHPPCLRAVQIMMLTGQRVEEIARLHVDQWDAAERCRSHRSRARLACRKKFATAFRSTR